MFGSWLPWERPASQPPQQGSNVSALWHATKKTFWKITGSLPAHRLLMIGQTGSGKTSFLNLMCNMPVMYSNIHDPGFFRDYHDIELEGDSKKVMASKTEGVAVYEVPAKMFEKLSILDTPGFGDTRGFDIDKAHVDCIIHALQHVEYINGLCLFINGRESRMSATLRYVLSEIASILPVTVLENIFVVFTNVEDWCALNFDPEELTQYLRGKPLTESRMFLLDNPYSKLQKVKQRQGVLQGRLAESLMKSFQEAAKILRNIESLISELPRIHTHEFLHLYDKKQSIERSLLTALGALDEATRVESEMQKKQEEVEAAIHRRDLNKDFTFTSTISVWVTSDTTTHNTLCSTPGCYSNCHLDCHLEKSLDNRQFRFCTAFGRHNWSGGRCYRSYEGYSHGDDTNLCLKCGHHYTAHYHNECKWVSVEREQNGINEEMQARFNAAQTDSERASAAREGLQLQLEESAKNKARIYEELEKQLQEYRQMASFSNFPLIYEAKVNLVKEWLQDLSAETDAAAEAETLRKKYEKIERMSAVICEVQPAGSEDDIDDSDSAQAPNSAVDEQTGVTVAPSENEHEDCLSGKITPDDSVSQVVPRSEAPTNGPDDHGSWFHVANDKPPSEFYIGSHISAPGEADKTSDVGSWIAVEAPAGPGQRCFLPQTLVQTPLQSFVQVSSLEVGHRILSAKGNTLVVLRAINHEEQYIQLVELQAGPATLVVTADHRVMVQSAKGRPTAKLAGKLEFPAQVICNNGEAQELHSVKKFLGWTNFVELLFNPDEAVSAFLPPQLTILTKGAAHGMKGTRRGGMCRRQTNGSDTDSNETYKD
mmetsp:Transcript_92063/g.159756  ORF Transcript_92063/g.159756 Transcript_92063/m.159756 type:complete len:824 (-) Transcript_92063:116-2587(-)